MEGTRPNPQQLTRHQRFEAPSKWLSYRLLIQAAVTTQLRNSSQTPRQVSWTFCRFDRSVGPMRARLSGFCPCSRRPSNFGCRLDPIHPNNNLPARGLIWIEERTGRVVKKMLRRKW